VTNYCRRKKEGVRGKGTEDSPMRCKSALQEQYLECLQSERYDMLIWKRRAWNVLVWVTNLYYTLCVFLSKWNCC